MFMIKAGGATPAYAEVGQVSAIGDIAVTADEVEVTTLDAGDYRDYIQGFKDPGECELTVIFDPALADQGTDADGLIGLFTSGEVRDCAIRWNSSDTGGQAYGTFQAFIRDMTFNALNPDDPQTLTPLFRLKTPITVVDTLPAADGVSTPSTVTTNAGSTPQSAAASAAFAQPLAVTVKDSGGTPVAGATVTYTVPGSGASAVLAPGNTALTNASGVASVTATANATAGAFNVTAAVAGVATPATFALTIT